jgi:hypothetical protein
MWYIVGRTGPGIEVAQTRGASYALADIVVLLVVAWWSQGAGNGGSLCLPLHAGEAVTPRHL